MCGKKYPTIFTSSDNCTVTTKKIPIIGLFLTWLKHYQTDKHCRFIFSCSKVLLWVFCPMAHSHSFSIHVPNLPLCTRVFFPHHHVLPWVAVLIHVSLPHVFLPLFMSLLLPLFNKILIVIWPEGVILICHSSKGWNRFRGDEWWASYVSRYIGTSLNLT